MTTSEQSSEATDPDKAAAAPAKAATKATAKPARKSAGKNSTEASTDGVPALVRPIYNTAPGKKLYDVTSNAALFLRYGVVAALALGLLYTLFNVISVRGAGIATILSTFAFSLLVTLVATGVLYALRTVLERQQGQE